MRPPNTSTRHAPHEAKVETDKRVREVDLRFSPPACCTPYASTMRWVEPCQALARDLEPEDIVVDTGLPGIVGGR